MPAFDQHQADHRRRGGLPVRPGDADAVLEPHDLGEHLGAADDRDLPRCASTTSGLSGRHGRGIDDRVHIRFEVGGVVPDMDCRRPDPSAAPCCRSPAPVGPGDREPLVDQDFGDAAHPDAADADEVQRSNRREHDILVLGGSYDCGRDLGPLRGRNFSHRLVLRRGTRWAILPISVQSSFSFS